jgi:hypothetical protein
LYPLTLTLSPGGEREFIMGSLLFQDGMVITPLTIGAEIEFIHDVHMGRGKKEVSSPLCGRGMG